MALSIDIAANTRQASSQIKTLGDGLDDVVQNLQDVGKGSKEAGDKLERALKDAEQQAKRTDKAVDGIGDSGAKGFGKAKAASGEFKTEAVANFSEVTSSFDGSMSSVQDLAQGTLGGLAQSGLPGVGIAAGLAAAAIGLIGSAIASNAEALALNEQDVADWAQSYVDAGGTIVEATGQIARYNAIMLDPEKYKVAGENAKNWGVDVSTAALAMSGDIDSLTMSQASLRDRTKEAKDEATASIFKQEDMSASTAKLTGETERGNAAMSQITKTMAAGRERADQISEGYKRLINSTSGATVQTDNLGNSIYHLPGGKDIFIDAKTGIASDNVARFKGDLSTVPTAVTTTVVFKADASDVDRVRRRIQEQINVGVNVVVPRGTVAWN